MIAHAAALSAQGVSHNTHVVILTGSLEQLQQLEKELTWDGISHTAFHEPDAPYLGALMSIGIEPLTERRMVRRYLKRFQLLGESHEVDSVETGSRDAAQVGA